MTSAARRLASKILELRAVGFGLGDRLPTNYCRLRAMRDPEGMGELRPSLLPMTAEKEWQMPKGLKGERRPADALVARKL
jgi:hypothetical protein